MNAEEFIKNYGGSGTDPTMAQYCIDKHPDLNIFTRLFEPKDYLFNPHKGIGWITDTDTGMFLSCDWARHEALLQICFGLKEREAFERGWIRTTDRQRAHVLRLMCKKRLNKDQVRTVRDMYGIEAVKQIQQPKLDTPIREARTVWKQ